MGVSMKKKVKKLWKGNMVTVRDYEVAKCLRLQQPMQIYFNDECMTVDVKRLERLQNSGQFFKSKTGGQDYNLIDLFWEPDIINDMQHTLL
tara:strand:- start:1603 stop:1875 length:273 start_codon:yes stop_codon:yes gene_type:complete